MTGGRWCAMNSVTENGTKCVMSRGRPSAVTRSCAYGIIAGSSHEALGGDQMLIGYTTGVFDMFHIGHLRILERAKAECDQLIVGITTDELSLAEKGGRPIVPFYERRQIVSAVRCVDMTVPQTSMDKRQACHASRRL